MDLLATRPARWILPAWWRTWEGYRVVRPKQTHRLVIRQKGGARPKQLTESLITEFLTVLEREFDPDLRGYLDQAEYAGDLLARFGPLLPTPPRALHLEWVSASRRAVVPSVPSECDVEELWDELTLLRTGVRLALAMFDDSTREQALVAEHLNALEQRFDKVSTRWVTVHPTMDFFAARALEDEERFGAPSGPKGIAIAIFEYMVQRWPVTIFATAQFQHRPVPLPQSPMHIVWISLAHSAGALQLPMVPLVRYCGYSPCGKPIISTRPRKRGTRWFCDPEGDASRSTCQNRFFAEQGRKRARERGTPKDV